MGKLYHWKIGDYSFLSCIVKKHRLLCEICGHVSNHKQRFSKRSFARVSSCVKAEEVIIKVVSFVILVCDIIHMYLVPFSAIITSSTVLQSWDHMSRLLLFCHADCKDVGKCLPL